MLVLNKKEIVLLKVYKAGDFRSPECIELLEESDIVVTNPPFSLFREFIAQLVEYNKKFLILGNVNAILCKKIFPLFKNNKIWLGISIRSDTREFYIPFDYDVSTSTSNRIDSENNRVIKMGNIRWFTNLTINYKQKPIALKEYYTPEKYPKYDNYDAINVDKVADIPCDYPGVMGVPISFMDKYCPEQFRILGDETILKISSGRGYVNGKRKYARVFVRNRQPEWNKYRYNKVIKHYFPEKYIPALTGCAIVNYIKKLQAELTKSSLKYADIKNVG